MEQQQRSVEQHIAVLGNFRNRNRVGQQDSWTRELHEQEQGWAATGTGLKVVLLGYFVGQRARALGIVGSAGAVDQGQLGSPAGGSNRGVVASMSRSRKL